MDDKRKQNVANGYAINIEKRSDQRTSFGGGYFEIHVKGHLNSKWSDWLGGLDIELLDQGEMVLSGFILDQAALMGILDKLNRLNLALLSVSEVSKE